jgi:hypothetical protein
MEEKKRKSIIHDSIKGYGWEAHKLEVIEEIADELLNDREVFWIKELNTFYLDNEKGMNMTRGGDGNGVSWMHDIERRKKQSESRKGEKELFTVNIIPRKLKDTLQNLCQKEIKSKVLKFLKWGQKRKA